MYPKKEISKKLLYRLYVTEKKSIRQIAKLLNIGKTTVSRNLRDHKIKIRHRSETKRLNLSKQFLIKEYITNKKSSVDIAKEIGCSSTTVQFYLKKYNIEIRNPSDAQLDKSSRKNNGNWKGGITDLRFLIRHLLETKEWRKQVFQRDNYTCQECEQLGGDLHAHHINPFANLLSEFLKEYDQFSLIEDKETLVRLAMKWQPFWEVDNGKTLCKDCHNKTKKGRQGIKI